MTTEYERLKAQKDAILAKEKARGDALMKQLEGTLMGKLRETEAERDQLRADLAAARAALATATQLLPWVSVSDRLPEANTGLRYLVWTQDGGKDMAEYGDRQERAWFTDDG